MKIGILSRSPKCYSTRRLVEAATNRGHEVRVINALKCYMNITAEKPVVHFKDNSIDEQLEFDAVIPRIGASITNYGNAVLRQFEIAGTYVTTGSVAISRSRDKLRAHQFLAKAGISMPITSYAHSANSRQELIKFVGGAPLIVKMLQSTHGKGVLLAETNKAAESLISAFLNLPTDFLVQEFIKEAEGADIRCFVIGDKVVASMKRQAIEGEFRSNLHCGASASAIKLKPEERAIAVQAAKILGLKIAGVDIVTSNRGPLVLEVNSSPGLQGIEKASNKKVAEAIIEFLEKDYVKKRPKAK